MKTFNEWCLDKLIKENEWLEDVADIAQYLLILKLAAPEVYQAVVGNFAWPIEKAASGMTWLVDKVKMLFSKAHGAPIQKAQQTFAALTAREKRQVGIATRMVK